MRKLIPLIMIFSLILAACSKEKEEIEENAIRALVVEIQENTIVIESMESIYSGKIIIPIQENLKVDNVVDVYYKGEIQPGSPGEIFEVSKVEIITENHSSDQEKNEDSSNSTNEGETDSSESISQEENKDNKKNEEKEVGKKNKKDSKYYDYPILSISKSGAKSELRDNDSALIRELVDTVEWGKGLESINKDYIINDGEGFELEYDSKAGILNDVNNDIHVKLHSELQAVLMLALTGKL